MHKLKLFSVLAVSAAVVFSGCGKDEENAPEVSPGKIVGKKWKMTAASVSPAFTYEGETFSDLYALMDDCEKDNTIMYTPADASNMGGVALTDEGATKCDPSDDQMSTGTWFYNTEKTKLTQVMGSDSVTVDIIELSNSTMRQRYVQSEDGQTYTVVATFAAQN